MNESPAWEGVDKTVVERIASEAGRPARDSFIPAPSGDLLLTAFLLAGAIGGFIIGYTFRALFPPREKAHSVDATAEVDKGEP
jgi:ABC-type cobalt transport system substrate-binding protein